MQIMSGRIATAIKVVIYGPEGIGKSTFASQFPDPLFIDTEGSTVHMDVKRLPRPDLWAELLNEVEYVRQNPGCCKTLVLDTADWAETLCGEYICSRDQKTGIEDYGYGKGYKYLFEEFGRLLNALELVRGQGVNVVICCHATIRKFEQPDELGAYDRWGLKLTDSPKASIAGMVKEWADMVIFANYKTIVVNVDGKGATKGKNKVQGGKRVMYTSHHSCWDAKNRFGLPEEMDFGYEGIRRVIEGTGSPTTADAVPLPIDMGRQEKAATTAQESVSMAGQGSGLARRVEAAAKGAEKKRETERPTAPTGHFPADAGRQEKPQAVHAAVNAADVGLEYAGLPDALARMMQEAGVKPDEVRYVIAQKGIYPADTPWAVIVQNKQFMEGWLLHPQVWPKVVEAAVANREEVPF